MTLQKHSKSSRNLSKRVNALRLHGFYQRMLIPSICIQTNDIIAKTLPLLVNKAIISIDIKSKKINYLLRSLTFLKILTGKLPQIKENRRFAKSTTFKLTLRNMDLYMLLNYINKFKLDPENNSLISDFGVTSQGTITFAISDIANLLYEDINFDYVNYAYNLKVLVTSKQELLNYEDAGILKASYLGLQK